MKYSPPRWERIVTRFCSEARKNFRIFAEGKHISALHVREYAVLRRYLAINSWYRQMADKAGRVDLRQTMWMHPYLPSCDIVYSHPLVQPDCNSLEVCSMENQGRYLQRGNTQSLSNWANIPLVASTGWPKGKIRGNDRRGSRNESSREHVPHVSREISNWILFVLLATIGFARSKICFNFIFHFLCRLFLYRVLDYISMEKLSDRSIDKIGNAH